MAKGDNSGNAGMGARFGQMGERVQFERDELIERAKLAIHKNTLRGLKGQECLDYLDSLKDKKEEEVAPMEEKRKTFIFITIEWNKALNKAHKISGTHRRLAVVSKALEDICQKHGWTTKEFEDYLTQHKSYERPNQTTES